MVRNPIVTENKLDDWVHGNSQIAQGVIVDLVLNLVSASSPKPKERHFPRRDSIGQHGPDGVLDVNIGYPPFVPEGKSYWEIGTGNDAGAKATKDYKSLTDSTPQSEREQSTFVFITPLSGRTNWPYTWKKDAQIAWLNDRRRRNDWRNVEIIDGTKLIDWLQHFPSVELWLASEMGIPAKQMETLEQRWSVLKSIGEPPPLSPNVFLINRDEACIKVKEFFSGTLLQLKVDTYYPDQVANFVAAYLASVDENFRLDTNGLCLIIKGSDAWNAITELDDPHFLIADFDIEGDGSNATILLAKARRARHAVIYGGTTGGQPHPNRVSIPNPKSYQIQEALEKAGYNEGRARSLAQKSDGNLDSLLRLLHNLSFTPQWAQGTDAAELAIAELIGSWDEKSDNDRTVVERISGNSYGEWIGKIRDVAFQPGTPLTYRNSVWKFVARYEGWYALGPRLFDECLDNFRSVTTTILREHDPKFELPSSQRFAANIHGKVLSYSHVLRKGSAESLALLGSHSGALTTCSSGKAEATARLSVREILKNADWILWASLNDLLPLLAEASPKEFLDAVDEALSSDPCPFDMVYAQENNEGIGGANYMTGLLWSLESLAWDPEYLTHVVVTLGELAARDPGGNWSNRPANSLNAILLPWLPQTCATITQRRTAVETLIHENPKIAWNLLISLLPQSVTVSSGSYRPRWRENIPDDYSKGVTHQEYWEQISSYAELALSMAKNDMVRLADLIDNISNLPLKVQDQLLAYLVSAEITTLSESDRLPLWTKLVNIVTRHRKYADAKWAMKTEDIEKIAAVADQLAPFMPFYRHQRLFNERSFDLFEDAGDFAAQNKKLEEARLQAISEILKLGGISAVFEFVSHVESPWYAGIACGMVSTNEIDSSILPNFIENKDKSLTQFSGGFIVGKFRIQSWQWVDQIETKTWSPIQIGLFLAYLPFTSETWDRVSTLLEDNAFLYWSKANANPYETKSNLEFAIEQLIRYKRPISAIRCLDGIRYQNQPLKTDLVVKSLDAVIGTKEHLTTTDQYAIVELIKVLQSDPNINPEDLFKIEWRYLPLLDYHFNASPRFLERKLADEPEFFCEIIRTIYRSKREEPAEEAITEQEKNIATNAYRLLEEWKTPPGSQKDSSYNGEALVTWLDAVKKECSETGHLEVAMIKAGHVLIHTPSDPDGLWIHHSAAAVLNAKDANNLREGFKTALFNARGAYFFTAGEEEKKLEKEYRTKAEAVESRGYYRLADTLKILAASYRHDAEHAAKSGPIDE